MKAPRPASRHSADLAFRVLAMSTLVIALLTLAALIIDVLLDGGGRLSWRFLTSLASRRPEAAGIYHALAGSIWVIVITGALALPKDTLPKDTLAKDTLTKGTPSVAAPAEPESKVADAKGSDTKAPDTKAADVKPAPAKPEAAPQKGAEAETAKPTLAAKSALPRVTDMASLSHDLAGIPAGAGSLRQAALEGDGAAIYELASRSVDGRGLPRDTALAAKLFDRLAGAGYAPAQYRLGSQYEKGLGLVRDQEKARLWYGRAAMQGHVRAMHNLAVMQAESGAAGGKPDYTSAATWFRKAAEYGVRDSQYNLAVLQARGLGVTQDLSQAYGWFAAAAAQGDDDAGRKRDEVASKLAPKDLAAARSAAEAWKARIPDPLVNDPPAARVETAANPGAMSLIGAPPPLAVGRGTGKV